MQALAVFIVLTVIIITSLALVRVSLAGSGGVWGRRGVPPAGAPEPGFSPPPPPPTSEQPDGASAYWLPARQAPGLRHHLHAAVQPRAEQTLLRLRQSGPGDALLSLPGQWVSRALSFTFPGPPCLPSHCSHPSILCSSFGSFHLSSFPPLISPPGLHPSDPTVFYPFFLIQDLVTGDSGSFQGR